LGLRKNISFTFIAQIVNAIFAFLSTVLLTRILGAEGRGEYAIFTNSIGFSVIFFGFSITSTIPYFINSGKAKTEDLLSTILLFVGLSTLLAYTTLIVLNYFGKLNIALPESVQSHKYILLFVFSFVSTLLASVFNSFLITFKKFKEVAYLSILTQIIPLIIYGLLFLSVIKFNKAMPIVAVINTITIVSALSLLFSIVAFRFYVKAPFSSKILPWFLIKNFVLFTVMAYIGNVFQFFSYKIDFWFVDAYCGKQNLGIYSLAAQLAQLLWIVPQSLSSVLYSYASKMESAEALSYAIKFKKIAFYATLLLALIGIAFAYFFLPILFGAEFRKSFGLLAVFLMGVVPFSVPVVIAGFFAAMGKFKMSFYASVSITIVTVILYSILIPKYGVYGGAVASVISYVISFAISEYWLTHFYDVKTLGTYKINFSTLKQDIISLKNKSVQQV
jgi:O-antigen/teichoic acid export membrane protein